MGFSYKIVANDLSLNTETTLLEINDTEIFFANITPISRANHVLNVYGNLFINNEDELNNYDGTFSLTSQGSTYSDDIAADIDRLFNVLLNCENNNTIISIYVRVTNDNIITNYTTILDKAQVHLVVKTLKTEKQDVIGLLSTVYTKTT